MKFQVTQIEFDFDEYDEYVDNTGQEIYLSIIEKQQLVDEVIGQIWDADDAEHLVDKISDETGWCIKSIDYTVFIPGILS
jgi:hypothetical protein